MAIDYPQTQTAAPCGVIQACAPVAPAADADAVEAAVGGTAGGTELACGVAPGASELCFAAQLAIADDTSLDAGDLTTRLNITTAQGDLTLEEIYVCRLSAACASQETLGSVTGLGLDISAGGVFSQVVTLAAASAHDPGDSVYVAHVFANAHNHTTRSVAITPDQLISTPWSAAAGSSGRGPLLGMRRNRFILT